MKLLDFLKDIGIPLISVGTAVMVGVLNYRISANDQALRERDQQLTQKVGALDLLVKQSREEREERESNQNFNIKIYDIVIQSLEEGNQRKQEAAKAFVVVMVDEPLRSSLLNVLRQGGDPVVKADIGRILAQEKNFQNNLAVAPATNRADTPSYRWEKWDVDLFWCSSSGNRARQQAEAMGEQLVAEGAKGRIRIRELPASINARSGYQVDGYMIRWNSNESDVADALKQLADKVLVRNNIRETFSLGLSRQDTPWYISAFVCPANT